MEHDEKCGLYLLSRAQQIIIKPPPTIHYSLFTFDAALRPCCGVERHPLHFIHPVHTIHSIHTTSLPFWLTLTAFRSLSVPFWGSIRVWAKPPVNISGTAGKSGLSGVLSRVHHLSKPSEELRGCEG
jgi:hypothetical protein